MKTSRVLPIFAILLALLVWRIGSHRGKDMTKAVVEGASAAVVIDNSGSQTVNCDQISALVSTAISELSLGRGSQLTLYTLGTSANSFEPVPRLTVALEKSVAGTRKALKKVQGACAGIRTAEGSSIFRAVEVALMQLPHKPGDILYLQSDLEETVDGRLTRHRSKKAAPPLKNTGINTLLCGVAAASAGDPRGERANALTKLWTAAFAVPPRVQPFCPGQTSGQTVAVR